MLINNNNKNYYYYYFIIIIIIIVVIFIIIIIVASVSSSYQTGIGPVTFFCPSGPFASRFDVLYIERWFPSTDCLFSSDLI